MHVKIMIQDQSGSNLGNGGKGKEWLVDKNKGDNYVIILL